MCVGSTLVIFAVLGMPAGVVPLRFQWDLVVVSFQPCLLCGLAIYSEEGAVVPQEIPEFQWLVESVTPLWKEEWMHHQV